jgi:hypothetical protein
MGKHYFVTGYLRDELRSALLDKVVRFELPLPSA